MNSTNLQIRTSLVSALVGGTAPRQLAMGFTLGMTIGFLPKDSILTYALALTAVAFAANIVCVVFAASCFSIVSWLAEPQLHKLGAIALSNEALLRFWAGVYQMPFMPWTRFNNTIVMGGLVASIVFAYPTYRLSRTLAPILFAKITRVLMTPGLIGPTATSQMGSR